MRTAVPDSPSTLLFGGDGVGGTGVGGIGVGGTGVGGTGVGGGPFSTQSVHDTPLSEKSFSIGRQLAQHLPPRSTPLMTTAYGMPQASVQ